MLTQNNESDFDVFFYLLDIFHILDHSFIVLLLVLFLTRFPPVPPCQNHPP